MNSTDFWLVRKTNGMCLKPLVALERLAQLEPVHLRHLGVGEHQVRRADLDLLERVLAVDGRGDGEAGLLQADLHHAQALRVAVDEEEVLLGHGWIMAAVVSGVNVCGRVESTPGDRSLTASCLAHERGSEMKEPKRRFCARPCSGVPGRRRRGRRESCCSRRRTSPPAAPSSRATCCSKQGRRSRSSSRFPARTGRSPPRPASPGCAASRRTGSPPGWESSSWP